MTDLDKDASDPPSEETCQRLQLLTDSSVSSTPILYYFNARGRAEIIRYVFALKEIPYHDIRCKPHPHAMTDFELLKKYKSLPFGQLPLLEIDGIALAQSQAILRYIGQKYDLFGDTKQEAALVDMIGCATEDVRQKFTSSVFHWNDIKSQPYLPHFRSTVCPQWGGYLEKLLEKNKGTWFVGSRISCGDLAVYDMITHIQSCIPDAFQEFNLLTEHVERVQSIPQIARWLATRPVTSV